MTELKKNPLRGEKRYDEHGSIRCMGVINGYVMCRRPECRPIVKSLSEWFAMSEIEIPDKF